LHAYNQSIDVAIIEYISSYTVELVCNCEWRYLDLPKNKSFFKFKFKP